MAWIERYSTGSGERRYRVGWRNPDGTKGSKSFPRAGDAETYKREVERRESLGELFREEPVPFGEFAGLRWNRSTGCVVIDEDAPTSWVKRYRPTVRASSFGRREETFKHLTELLPLTFDRITPALVQDVVTQLASAHPRQAQYVQQTIKMIVREAGLRGQPVREAVLRLSPPTYTARRPRFLTMDQVNALAEASGHPRLIRFAALTGTRFVEVSGLTDNDVALGDRAILIHRDITKSEAGVRRIPLVQEAKAILDEQRRERVAGSVHLFPSPRGGQMTYANFYNRVWIPARTAYGRVELGFHDLRHTFASLSIAAGVHPRVLKDLMGHESIKVTMDTYGHLYEDAGEQAMEQLDGFLQTARPIAAPSAESG